jgi:hypothetical protein
MKTEVIVPFFYPANNTNMPRKIASHNNCASL